MARHSEHRTLGEAEIWQQEQELIRSAYLEQCDGLDGLEDDEIASATPQVPSLHYAFGTEIMRYFIYNDPDWTYVDYNLEILRKDAARVALTLNATDPDL